MEEISVPEAVVQHETCARCGQKADIITDMFSGNPEHIDNYDGDEEYVADVVVSECVCTSCNWSARYA